MADCPFKVGDRVRYKRDVRGNNAWAGPFDHAVTVTELTATGGFKWKTDQPISLGSRFGTFSEGECYNPAIYELEPSDVHPKGNAPNDRSPGESR